MSHVYIFHTQGYWCAQAVRVPVSSVLLCPLLAYTESLANVEENSASTFLLNTGVPAPESLRVELSIHIIACTMDVAEYRLFVIKEFSNIGVLLYHFPLLS